jgi:signal peptide peptidase SppA
MPKQDALLAAASLQAKPILADDFFAAGAGDGRSAMVDALHALAEADVTAEIEAFISTKLLLVASYGLVAASSDKPFAFGQTRSGKGVAVIPVWGMLINRFPYSFGYVTGYNFIQSQLRAALADDDVDMIAYDVNSGGGMFMGCDELAAEVFASRDAKPSVALVDAYAASAAYYVASSATRMYATPTAGVGSIGVLGVRMDFSGALDKMGIKANVVYKGANKLDSNPLVPFSDEAKARWQADIDNAYGMFVSAVSRNRGMDPEDVRNTEASMYNPTDAVQLGLIDGIAAAGAALMQAMKVLLPDDPNEGGGRDDDPAEDDEDEDPNDPDGEMEMALTPEQKAARENVDAALTAERARVSGILNCEEAKQRPALAQFFATKTTMSVEDAQAALKVAAVETPSVAASGAAGASVTGAAGNLLDAAMTNTPASGVKVGAGGSNTETLSMAEQIMQAQDLATGTTSLSDHRKRRSAVS